MFQLRRATLRALAVSAAPCASKRITFARVLPAQPDLCSMTRSFSYLQPRFADNMPAGQEAAATSESTDAVPDVQKSDGATQLEDAVAESKQQWPTHKDETAGMTEAEASITTVYVGNLPWGVERAHLDDHMAQHGKLLTSRLARTPEGRLKGFGFFEYANVESANAAVSALEGSEYHGRVLRVRIAERARRAARVYDTFPPGKCLYVGNLSFDLTDKELNDIFRNIKGVLDVRVAIDRRTGQPRGFAHADFVDINSATSAKEILAGKAVNNRILRVDFAPPPRATALTDQPPS